MSLRSFGGIEGGADTLLDGLLDVGCTVMVVTGSHAAFGQRPPKGMRPARNGTNYSDTSWWPETHDRIFTPHSADIDESLGVFPRLVVERNDRHRGDHPLSSLSAIGPLAAQLVGSQDPLNVGAPLEELVAHEGNVVLMGVGLTRMTLIHLAEERAGRTRFRRWARLRDGTVQMVESGSCSEGFEKLAPSLAPVRREVTVGGSQWSAYPAAEVLELATRAIEADPSITHCGQRCDRCDDAVVGGPLI